DFDTAARYGGEEFAVILPSCSSAESLVVAERLRESIAGIETVSPVTASAGVATFPAHAGDPEALIKAADEALYESKRAGRNRVTRSRRRKPKKTKLVVLPES
ncbi:MAG TPA: GGDEF domain-containing protein, partial [Actinomycetota bacterium]|nr:GGDEF domain-containing protein [Actinomycetota bacterium]